MSVENIQSAEVVLPVQDLKTEMPFFLRDLGFRLDTIYPADDPAVAVISGHGIRVRLQRDAGLAPGLVNLHCDDPKALSPDGSTLVSPNGNRIDIHDANPPMVIPETRHSFMVRKLADSDVGSLVAQACSIEI